MGKDNYKTRRETLMFGDLVRLILEILRYISLPLVSDRNTIFIHKAINKRVTLHGANQQH